MNLGFFGGTFDPIHFGHIHLALRLKEAHKLDQVFFCPTSVSPFKTHRPPVATAMQRKTMVALAIQPIAGLELLDEELGQEAPSYTIDTLRRIGGKGKWHLILGEDALLNFEKWREPKELLCLASPLVGSREGNFQKPSSLPLELWELLKKGLTPIPILDISSTELRERLKMGKYCGPYIPEKTLDYINRERIYSL